MFNNFDFNYFDFFKQACVQKIALKDNFFLSDFKDY